MLIPIPFQSADESEKTTRSMKLLVERILVLGLGSVHRAI
jgi:hypothetical protein